MGWGEEGEESVPMLSQDHHQPDTEEEWSQDSEEEVCIDTFKPSMYLKYFHFNLSVAFAKAAPISRNVR